MKKQNVHKSLARKMVPPGKRNLLPPSKPHKGYGGSLKCLDFQITSEESKCKDDSFRKDEYLEKMNMREGRTQNTLSKKTSS